MRSSYVWSGDASCPPVGRKTACVKKLHGDTDGEGRLRGKLRTRRQPTWLISLVSWDKMVTPMMQCSTLSCERKYHMNGTVVQARLQKAEAALLRRRGSSAHAPVESAWRQRWHFWTRSRPSDSRTSPVWWSGRTAGSKPGSRTLLTLAAWPDNSAHSSLSKARAGFKTGLLNYFFTNVGKLLVKKKDHIMLTRLGLEAFLRRH